MRNYIISFSLLSLVLFSALSARGQEPVRLMDPPSAGLIADSLLSATDDHCFYFAGIHLNAGDSELAPYYIASNNGGTVSQQYSALATAGLYKLMNRSQRFSWGAGIEAWGGYASSAGYERYMGDARFEVQQQHPERAWLQQAYVEAKYRSIFAVVGQKAKSSPIVSSQLSSGDLVWSGNARPPVGLRAGFIDFQNIPFTNGWLQINGEFGYFRQFDDKWLENHYNYYNHFITTDSWLHYKSLHFRTNPDQPFVFTIGAQSACQFGGTADYYEDGVVTRSVKMDADAKAFWRTFIAGSGGNSEGDKFVEGNHLGTWDMALDYHLTQDGTLRAYTEWLWEDGSGIGKMNGFDGLWGIEYRNQGGRRAIDGAVIELLEMTNHSGPVHWAPGDHEGTPITAEATGADDYYNNYIYNGYQSRGMSIGSPFVKSPLYNRDGYMRYRDNVMRGVHTAVSGWFTDNCAYRLMASYRKAWGTPLIPRAGYAEDFSMSMQLTYLPPCLRGLHVKAQVAFDCGSLYGDNVGALLGFVYTGSFNFKKR